MAAKKAPIPGQIVASIPWKTGILAVRYPRVSDWQPAWTYINTLSSEQTFILMQGNHITKEQEKNFITSLLLQQKLKQGVHLFLTDGKRIIGSAGITLKRFAEKHVGVLGISISPEFRDGGVGTFYLKTIIEEAKKQLPGITLITLDVFANNERARHVYKKVGFQEYGKLPNGLRYKGEFVDAIMMYLAI